MFHWAELTHMTTPIWGKVEIVLFLFFRSGHKWRVDFEQDRKLAVSYTGKKSSEIKNK